jgi:hypothetical protein
MSMGVTFLCRCASCRRAGQVSFEVVVGDTSSPRQQAGKVCVPTRRPFACPWLWRVGTRTINPTQSGEAKARRRRSDAVGECELRTLALLGGGLIVDHLFQQLVPYQHAGRVVLEHPRVVHPLVPPVARHGKPHAVEEKPQNMYTSSLESARAPATKRSSGAGEGGWSQSFWFAGEGFKV